MANLNRVLLIGNLTRDPELRVTPKGTAICQFGLAISRSFKDESGQTREEATFVDIEAWGKQGELIAKYCTKGRPLFVEGRLRFDQWEDKATQQKRSKLKVVLENFQFLGGREGGAPGAGGQGGASDDAGVDQTYERPSAPAPRAPGGGRPAPAPQHDINDEDVPF
ncbi:MAG: single-stranded DNA-binding protein [Opitutaceae bacterium]|jgi:single-strand DNA-binding protein|nr:single-stranded DNA-binding protein [Opitutaceae bacterium]